MLVAIFAIALIVRVIALTAAGFNSDEAVYAGQAGALLHVSDFERFFSLFRAHPLLFQATVGLVFRVTGPSDPRPGSSPCASGWPPWASRGPPPASSTGGGQAC